MGFRPDSLQLRILQALARFQLGRVQLVTKTGEPIVGATLSCEWVPRVLLDAELSPVNDDEIRRALRDIHMRGLVKTKVGNPYNGWASRFWFARDDGQFVEFRTVHAGKRNEQEQRGDGDSASVELQERRGR